MIRTCEGEVPSGSTVVSAKISVRLPSLPTLKTVMLGAIAGVSPASSSPRLRT